MVNQKIIKSNNTNKESDLDLFYKILDLSICKDVDFRRKELNKIHNLCSTPS